VTFGTTGEDHPGCSKSSFSKAAASEGPEAYPLGYVEGLNDVRTKLADFFSILLVRLLGTVEADAKLDRAMVGFTAGAGAGDFGIPVCGVVVESTECISTLGDGCPGLVGSGDIGHEAACGEGHATALRCFSFCHTETARLFCRGV